jgi:hypothetical protein
MVSVYDIGTDSAKLRKVSMDKTLLLLLVISGLLLLVLAPHATLTLTAAIALAALTTRMIWAFGQSFESVTPSQATD